MSVNWVEHSAARREKQGGQGGQGGETMDIDRSEAETTGTNTEDEGGS